MPQWVADQPRPGKQGLLILPAQGKQRAVQPVHIGGQARVAPCRHARGHRILTALIQHRQAVFALIGGNLRGDFHPADKRGA